MLLVKYACGQYFAFARAHSRPMLKASRIAPREVVFIAMILAIFMVSVEATIVATAMPTIVGDLGGLRYFSWVFGAYLLTQAVTIPIYGRLADFFGRKTLLIVAIVIFLTGSVLCGFAHDMLALILFRALQGIGAGGVQPVSTTIVGDLYLGRERARAQGYLSSAWAFSAVVAPLLGAFLMHTFGWPIIFWINVPLGFACIAVVVRAYHEDVQHVKHSIDYLGSSLLALGVGTLMFVLVMAGNIPAATAVALTVVAIAAIALLLRHETRTEEPMIPLALYRIRVIAVANAGNFCVGAMVMGVSAFMPTFVQAAMGKPAVIAGAVLGSLFVTWTGGTIGGARLQCFYSYRTVAIIGALPIVVGSAILATLRADSNIAAAFAGLLVIGLGFGTINSVFVITTQGAVEWEQRGAATSSNIFMRQIGQAVGSAGFGAVFNVGVYSRIPDAGNVLSQLVNPLRRALVPLSDLTLDVNAISLAMHGVFLIILVLAVGITGLVLALPAKLRLGQAPAAQGARAG
jgi:EmrB/QacA subfamily drug resistance transporter